MTIGEDMRNNVVIWPAVQTFPNAVADKEQVVKVLEEAAEVFGAWQEWDRYHSAHAVFDGPKAECAKAMKACIVDECADVIQAVSNLLAGVGVYDMKQAMFECYERNRKRGRC